MNARKLMLLLIDIAVILLVIAGVAAIYPVINTISLSGELFLKMLILAGLMLVARYILRVYNSIWRYANVGAYVKLMLADCSAYFVFLLLGQFIPGIYASFAFVTITVMAVMLATLASRFAYQLLYAHRNRTKEVRSDPNCNHKINIAIIGAGNIGVTLADELLRNPQAHYLPCCFIDNDRTKIGNSIRGIKVWPEDDEILQKLKQTSIQEIIIALPNADSDTRVALYEKYKQTGCKVKLYDFANEFSDSIGERRVIRDFKIEELLFRDSIRLNSERSAELYRDKVILVTGGGGSIGSELCRQIAKFRPKQLIIVDIYENNAYDIQQELTRKYGNELALTVLIASVRDYARIDRIFAQYRPDMVFHAAAHKHVPLMENSPMEAIKNNVFGTYNTANAAEKYGVKKFILISTDKAVNPTNVMGASKRLCEMIIQCRRDSKTEFAAVRFGNVLGSNGSVIPLFKQQILAGGPVTLTDKRIIRYFMTIPEAVELVMEAGTIARGGELFVLDMGKPVKILSLAEKMIRLMGFEPYTEIDIVEIGLRKGEKLYEELLMKTEELDKTDNNMIFIERDQPHTRVEMESKLKQLGEAMARNEVEAVFNAVRETVPTYQDPAVLNRKAESAPEMRMSNDTSVPLYV